MSHPTGNHEGGICLPKRVWLNVVNRQLLQSGKLERLIDRDEVTGVFSSSPCLAAHIAGDSEYRDTVCELARAGMSAEEIYRSVALEDTQYAADLLLPIFQKTEGCDGFAGIEVSPEFAYDVEALLEEGYSLWKQANRPNVMIQIPATPEAVPAIESLLQEGINVNATLIYTLTRCREVAEAHVAAMSRRNREGSSVRGIVSVATFSAHPQFNAAAAHNLHGGAIDLLWHISASSARSSRRMHRNIFETGKFLKLAAMGAQPMLLMWNDETDSAHTAMELDEAGDVSPALGTAPMGIDSSTGEDGGNMDWLPDILQEETIKLQVVQIDMALKAIRDMHSIDLQ